eukprot:CFRG0734T1
MPGAGSSRIGVLRRKSSKLRRTQSTQSRPTNEAILPDDVVQFSDVNGNQQVFDSTASTTSNTTRLTKNASIQSNTPSHIQRESLTPSLARIETRSCTRDNEIESRAKEGMSDDVSLASVRKSSVASAHSKTLKPLQESVRQSIDRSVIQEVDVSANDMSVRISPSPQHENLIFDSHDTISPDLDGEVIYTSGRPWEDEDIDQFKNALRQADLMDTDALDTTAIVVRLASTMYGFFIPSFVLSRTLPDVCDALSIDNIDFRFDPSGIFCTVGHVSRFVPVNTNFHIANAEAIEKVCEGLICHDITAEEANKQITYITGRGGLYPQWLRAIAWAFQTGGLSWIIFRSTRNGVIIGSLIGLAEGLFEEYLDRRSHPHIAMMEVYINGVMSSIVLLACHASGYLDCPLMPYLAIMAIHLPGLAATFGVMEMLTGHTVCGASRFTTAMITAQLIALGYTTGAYVIKFVHGNSVMDTYMDQNLCPTAAGVTWYGWMIFMVVAVCLCLLLDTHAFQFQYTGVLLLVTYLMIELMGEYTEVPDHLITLCCMTVTQIIASAMKWFFFTSKTAILEPTIVILVPGSLLVRSILFEYSANSDQTMAFTSAISLITLNISIGLMVGAAIVSAVVKIVHGVHRFKNDRRLKRLQKRVNERDTNAQTNSHNGDVQKSRRPTKASITQHHKDKSGNDSDQHIEHLSSSYMNTSDARMNIGMHEGGDVYTRVDVSEGMNEGVDVDKPSDILMGGKLRRLVSSVVSEIQLTATSNLRRIHTLSDDQQSASRPPVVENTNGENEDSQTSPTMPEIRHRWSSKVAIGLSRRGRLVTPSTFSRSRRNATHLSMI